MTKRLNLPHMYTHAGGMSNPTPEALVHGANVLLGRAGLLAGSSSCSSGKGQQQLHAGVPPLASLADVRAAAPALAVAVFEALLQVG